MIGKSTIVGRVARTPTVKTLPDGRRVAKLRIAARDYRIGKTARFVVVEQWGEAADRAEALVKGQTVQVEGLLEAHVYRGAVEWSMRYPDVEIGEPPLSAIDLEVLDAELQRRQAADGQVAA